MMFSSGQVESFGIQRKTTVMKNSAAMASFRSPPTFQNPIAKYACVRVRPLQKNRCEKSNNPLTFLVISLTESGLTDQRYVLLYALFARNPSQIFTIRPGFPASAVLKRRFAREKVRKYLIFNCRFIMQSIVFIISIDAIRRGRADTPPGGIAGRFRTCGEPRWKVQRLRLCQRVIDGRANGRRLRGIALFGRGARAVRIHLGGGAVARGSDAGAQPPSHQRIFDHARCHHR